MACDCGNVGIPKAIEFPEENNYPKVEDYEKAVNRFVRIQYNTVLFYQIAYYETALWKSESYSRFMDLFRKSRGDIYANLNEEERNEIIGLSTQWKGNFAILDEIKRLMDKAYERYITGIDRVTYPFYRALHGALLELSPDENGRAWAWNTFTYDSDTDSFIFDKNFWGCPSCGGGSCNCDSGPNPNPEPEPSIPEFPFLPPWFSLVPRIGIHISLIEVISKLIGNASTVASPLILDLDGDGVETTPIGGLTHFDHDGNGYAERSGWVSPDDALLVRDLNGDGQISSGAELFGNLTNGDAANGFEALAELDSNGDGIVDSRDAAWSQLRLWRDANGNGIVDAGELTTLQQAGVAGLYTDYANQTYVDEHGNEHRQAGSYLKTDGSTADMTDVWFATDPIHHVELDPVEVPDDILALPDVKGYGILSSFHQAMARDETGYLQGLVEQFVSETDVAARRALCAVRHHRFRLGGNYRCHFHARFIHSGRQGRRARKIPRPGISSGVGQLPRPKRRRAAGKGVRRSRQFRLRQPVFPVALPGPLPRGGCGRSYRRYP